MKANNAPDIVRITVSIPKTHAAKIKETATEHGISTASAVRILVVKALAAGITV